MDEIDLIVSFDDAHKQCANLPGRAKIESWPVGDEFRRQKAEAVNVEPSRGARDDIEKRVFALFMDYWRNVA